MAGGRIWTAEDDSCLAEKWGSVSMQSICKALDRSESSIRNRVYRMKLGAFLECGSYVTFNQFLRAIGCGSSYTWKANSWIKNRDFPIKTKRVNDCCFKVLYLDEFWKWAEQNRAYFDFSKIEHNALGMEPAWVTQQRRIDIAKQWKYPTPPWTPAEDKLLLDLLKQQRYGYLELSMRMGRTAGAIQRRACDLGIKYRPVKAYNHNGWTADELFRVGELVKAGCGYDLMAEKIGRSSKALRGLVYRYYFTERLDTVIRLIGDGSWGDDVPTPTVKDCKRIVSVKGDLQQLLELLRIRRNQLAFDGYWQKDLCMCWHPVKGCTAGESDCDSCTGFQRIREQYCRRCGTTIISRTQAHMCDRCKVARKKQAQKKWAVLHSGQ